MTTTAVPRRRKDAPPTEDVDPITIRFPKSLRARALNVALEEDRTFASLVIYALRRYVNDRERPNRERAGD
jgi:hypothetical protein